MIQVTPQQRANALFARDVMWPAVPSENVFHGLYPWRTNPTKRPTCHTLACFGGWVSVNPYFQAQGVSSDEDGVPIIRGTGAYGAGVAAILFGDENLFDARYEMNGSTSAHKLIERRLDSLISNSVVNKEKASASD